MKLTPEKIASVAQWVRENGLTDYGGASVEMLCKANDLNKSTYYEWIKKNKEFSNALKEAKECFKENLEVKLVASLARSATGYHYTKKRTEYGSDKDGKPIIKKQTIEDVEVQPNVGASIFLLTNINPDKWKNKVSNDVTADVKAETKTEGTYSLKDVPDDIITAMADAMQKAEFERLQKLKYGKEENAEPANGEQ